MLSETESDELERWLPIAGWPGYEVSDWGRVHSYLGAGGHGKRGRRGIGLTPKIINGCVGRSGRWVLLYRNSKRRQMRVHTLVLEAFVGPRPLGMEGCHNDGNPTNNRLDNLRWDTRGNNQRDSMRHGTHHFSILTEADIPKICEEIDAGESDGAIGRRWKVKAGAIGGIRTGRTWSHITGYQLSPLLTAMQAASGPSVSVDDEFANTHEEVFRPIPGWPAYRVSNCGRVQTCFERARVSGRRGGFRMFLTDRWRDRVPYPNRYGYQVFSAKREGEKQKLLTVHSCVLLAFAGPAPAGFVGCHNDGNRTNNHASNLRWDTTKGNAADRQRHMAAG